MPLFPHRSAKADVAATTFVVDGHKRAIEGIQAEIKAGIEQKYAREWNASGPLSRWFLRRRINRELAGVVGERSRGISDHSLF